MDGIDKKFEELEELARNNPVEENLVNNEEVIKENISVQPEPENQPESRAVKTISDMSYGQVTEFAKKSNLVSTAKDQNFVAELSEMNKDVLKESIALEKERVEADKLRIKLEQEKLETEKEKNLNERLREQFGAKLDAQAYHYKSLQPILETVGMKKPMNIILMWIIAVFVCIIPIYPIKLLVCATIGQLIAGANNESRKGFAKGVLWTSVVIIGIALMAVVIFGVVKLGAVFFG
jgi:hypothetical protein